MLAAIEEQTRTPRCVLRSISHAPTANMGRSVTQTIAPEPNNVVDSERKTGKQTDSETDRLRRALRIVLVLKQHQQPPSKLPRAGRLSVQITDLGAERAMTLGSCGMSNASLRRPLAAEMVGDELARSDDEHQLVHRLACTPERPVSSPRRGELGVVAAGAGAEHDGQRGRDFNGRAVELDLRRLSDPGGVQLQRASGADYIRSCCMCARGDVGWHTRPFAWFGMP